MKHKNKFYGLQMRAYGTLIGMLFASAICAEGQPSGEVGAGAASAVPAAAPAVPATAALDAGTAKLVGSCFACHGTNGNNAEADIPNIAGYSAYYLTGSLAKFKDKIRPCVETEIRSGEKKGSKTDMCQIAAGLSDSDVKQIGEFFAAQTFVRMPQPFDVGLATKGKAIQDSKCSTCHDKNGGLPDDNAGILAGQKMAYLMQQVKFFKEGKRPMHKRMKPKLESLDDGDVEAVVNFFVSQNANAETKTE